jgi:hypothetical protein
MLTIIRRFVLVGVCLFYTAAPIPAQTEGPMAAPPKFEVKRISSVPTPGPPPIPLPQLVQQVARNEDAIQQAYFTYTFDQFIFVKELAGPDDPGGDFTVTSRVSFEADGQRREHVLKSAASTLKRAYSLRFELDKLTSAPLFILTTAQLPNYNVTFEGEEMLDEIHAYILRVQPKQIGRAIRRFDGVVWVDDHDVAIVKSYGRFVSDVAHSESIDEPFQQFEIYRENIVGQMWFPTYVDSDSVISQQDGDLHLSLVMHSSNFHAAGAAAISRSASQVSPPGSGSTVPSSVPATSVPAKP